MGSMHSLPVEDIGAPLGGTSRTPNSRDIATNAFNRDTVVEQTIEHGLKPLMPNATPEELRAAWDKLTPNIQQQLTGQTSLTTRQVGELQRVLTREANPALKAINEGTATYLTPDQAQRSLGMSKGLREWRHGPADQGTSPSLYQRFMGHPLKPGQTGAIEQADKSASLAHIANEANDAIRFGGVNANAGTLATRSSMAGRPAALMNMGPLATTGLSLAGMLGLNPQTISGAGFLLSDLSQLGPGIWRGSEAVDQAKALMNKTKRREPK
jgi:hypothetical protein